MMITNKTKKLMEKEIKSLKRITKAQINQVNNGMEGKKINGII